MGIHNKIRKVDSDDDKLGNSMAYSFDEIVDNNMEIPIDDPN